MVHYQRTYFLVPHSVETTATSLRFPAEAPWVGFGVVAAAFIGPFLFFEFDPAMVQVGCCSIVVFRWSGPGSISLSCELCRISRFRWTTLFTRHNKNNTVGPTFFPSHVLRTASTQFPVHFCIQITGAPPSCLYCIQFLSIPKFHLRLLRYVAISLTQR